MDSQYSGSKSVRSSQIFYNIADDDMSEFFLEVVDEHAEKEEQEQPKLGKNNDSPLHQHEQTKPISKVIGEQVPITGVDGKRRISQEEMDEGEEVELEKEVVSRLEIEIEKNNLSFVGVYGEIFIMMFKCELVGETKVDQGIMLVTNYRLCFFKKRQKKVDLPFGFINTIKTIDKVCQLHVYLKYHHFWKFQASESRKYEQLKIFLQLYLKFDAPRSSFAYNYALKCTHKQEHPFLTKEFDRIGIDRNPAFTKALNKDFQLCDTYPEHIFIPASKSLGSSLMKVADKWCGHRFPIACYAYRGLSKEEFVLWRSAYVIADRDKMTEVAKYMQKIKGASKRILVFDTGAKASKKCVEEFQINSVCQMQYLDLGSLQIVKASYEDIIQCFLSVKKAFIRDIISSKWYDLVLQVLKAATRVKNSLMMENSTLLKCPDGRERSAQVSALAQIMMDPYYRTFAGFALLVEKEFRWLGYPFASRLGFRSEKDEQSLLFIQFLDCVSQLLHANQMSFQFNYKYLSKMSNLMYTCLFGTFITNSQKEWTLGSTGAETVPIWGQLISDLTTNAFYQNKHGSLIVPETMNEVRVWREHFWYLTSPPKQTYRLHPLAEDNHDYINLSCLRYVHENQQLQIEISKQRKQMQQLREQIEQVEIKKLEMKN